MCTCRTYRNLMIVCSLLLMMVMPQTAGAGPDPGDTVNAWYTVRDWVDQLRTPAENDAAGNIHITDGTGCCVILLSLIHI